MLRWSVRFLAVAAIFAAASMSASSAFAQRGGGGPGGFGGGPGGFGGGAGGLINLLQNEVRKEIEFLPEQQEKVEALQRAQREQLRNQFQGFRDLSEEERRERFQNLRTEMEERNKKLEADLKDILLPQQYTRLNQIALQQRIQRVGTVNALTSEELGLNVSAEQKAKLEELSKEAEKELQDKIAKARAEAVEKILSGLTPEQRAAAKEKLGAEFRMTQPRFGQFGQGGQGPGQGGRGQGGRGQGGRGQGGQGGGENRGI
jgi:Spy/CpxP family protein refolding chaperone